MDGLFFYCKQESWERENSVDPSEEGNVQPFN